MAAPDNQALADFLARHAKPDDADTDNYGERVGQAISAWDCLKQRRSANDTRRWDWRRIEVMDDAMAEVLRRKTPAERIAIGIGLWRSARKILRAQLASLHPEWDARRLEQEIARRLSHGAV